MRFLNKNKVICLGAHPDDVEYGMSGTFGECYNTEFFVVVLSNGGDFDNTTGDQRNSENENIWARYENVSGILDVGFVKSKHQEAMVNFVEQNMNGADTIVTTPSLDSHFEHQIVNNLGPALCRRSPISLVEYRTPSTLNHWVPNYFVNLSDKSYQKKKDVLKLFTTQQKAPYFSDKTIDSFHHNFQCHKKGLSIVESYRIVESFLG